MPADARCAAIFAASALNPVSSVDEYRHDRYRPLGFAQRQQVQHRIQVADHLLRARQIRLGDHEDVGNLEDAGLESLDTVSQVRRLDHDGRVADCADIDAVLSNADRLDQDQAEAHMREQVDQRRGGGANPPSWPRVAWLRTKRSGSPHDSIRTRSPSTAPPLTWLEDRPAAPRFVAVLAQFRQEMIDQRALAGAGRTGDADYVDRRRAVQGHPARRLRRAGRSRSTWQGEPARPDHPTGRDRIVPSLERLGDRLRRIIPDVVDDRGQREPGPKTSFDSHLLDSLHVPRRDRAAGDKQDMIKTSRLQLRDDLREKERCAPERMLRPTTWTSSCSAATAIMSGVWNRPV